MPQITVKLSNANGNIARVVGYIVTTKRKKDPVGGAPAPKRKTFISDYDQAALNPNTNEWVLTLQKIAGPRVRRNVLHVAAMDRRGRVIDSIIRKCKR
jgi:hypothetical protein